MGRNKKQVESQEDTESDEDIYIVEKLLERKIIDGKLKYKVKWLNYKETTWEPEKNLTSCAELIQEYEDDLKKRTQTIQVPPNFENDTEEESFTDPIANSSAHYITNIIGMTDEETNRNCDGKLMFLVKLSDGSYDFLESKFIRNKSPQLLIDYYEQRIKWIKGKGQQDKPEIANSSSKKSVASAGIRYE